MAAIDKIYGTEKEYDTFYEWAEKNRPDILKHFYPRDGCNNYDRPITNFPVRVDKWLLKNCPIKFVIDRIREQYDLKENEFL